MARDMKALLASLTPDQMKQVKMMRDQEHVYGKLFTEICNDRTLVLPGAENGTVVSGMLTAIARVVGAVMGANLVEHGREQALKRVIVTIREQMEKTGAENEAEEA